MEGKEVLKQLVIQANNRIEIMPGGGLRSTNILALDEMVNSIGIILLLLLMGVKQLVQAKLFS